MEMKGRVMAMAVVAEVGDCRGCTACSWWVVTCKDLMERRWWSMHSTTII